MPEIYAKKREMVGRLHMDSTEALVELYAASMPGNGWSRALDAVCDYAGLTASILYCQSDAGPKFEIETTSAFFADKSDLVNRYIQDYGCYDRQGISAVLKSPRLTMTKDTDVWPNLLIDENRPDLRFIKEQFGFYRRFGLNLSNRSGLSAALVAQLDERNAQIPSACMVRIAKLARHLRQSLEVARLFNVLYRRYSAVFSVFDRLKVGVIVMSPSSEVLIINEAARETIGGTDGCSIDRRNYFRLSSQTCNNRFCDTVYELSKTAEGRHTNRSGSFSVVGSDGKSVFLEISPIRDSVGEFDLGFSGCLITCLDPANPPQINIAAFASLNSLSVAETEVFALLIDGLTTKEIAEFRSVSLETTRNQVKSLLAKSSCSSRLEMIRQAVALSPPIE